MPENCQLSNALPHEPQRWVSPQLAYTEAFHTEVPDGEEQQATAAIADQLFSSFLAFSLIEHARQMHKYMLEHFPVPEMASRPDEPVVVSALTTCLIRWQNEVEDIAHPTREETTAVSEELVILVLALLHPAWVRMMPDLLQPASAADEEDERLLAALGYPGERLTLALTEKALDATSARIRGLTRRLATTVRQAVDEELTEALQNLCYPRRLTERQARRLRDQIAEEIQQDALLRQYFSTCRRIEVEPAGRTEHQVHLYFYAYSRHYGEMWVLEEKYWQREADKIRQKVKEKAW